MALTVDALLCPQNHRCPLIPICPAGAISQEGTSLPRIDPGKCIECGKCLNEGMTLCSLSKTGRLCPGELGELLGLTPSNTSKVLRSVEQKGLVTRELCNEDRRQMYYSLTQQGRELLASVSCREVETPEILRDWLCG